MAKIILIANKVETGVIHQYLILSSTTTYIKYDTATK
jgi:hypothetical protein